MAKKVQVLKTPGCSSCSKATELVEKIKEEGNLNLDIEELDITQHPELLVQHQIMVSPGIIINGKLEFAGIPDKKKLKEKLI